VYRPLRKLDRDGQHSGYGANEFSKLSPPALDQASHARHPPQVVPAHVVGFDHQHVGVLFWGLGDLGRCRVHRRVAGCGGNQMTRRGVRSAEPHATTVDANSKASTTGSAWIERDCGEWEILGLGASWAYGTFPGTCLEHATGRCAPSIATKSSGLMVKRRSQTSATTLREVATAGSRNGAVRRLDASSRPAGTRSPARPQESDPRSAAPPGCSDAIAAAMDATPSRTRGQRRGAPGRGFALTLT